MLTNKFPAKYGSTTELTFEGIKNKVNIFYAVDDELVDQKDVQELGKSLNTTVTVIGKDLKKIGGSRMDHFGLLE